MRRFDDPVDRGGAYHRMRQIEARLAGRDPRGWRINWEEIAESEHYAPTRNTKHQESLDSELLAEIGVGHPLYGKDIGVVAYLPGSDDVIVRVRDETADEPLRYLLVHLTYNLYPEPPPWPTIIEDVTFSGSW